MAGSSRDPYEVLGVARSASDAELRAAYRRQVQLHHPDHNSGSAESARRFEEVQEAYAAIRQIRVRDASSHAASGTGSPDLNARLADLERELKEAGAARERARHAAREAARASETPASDARRASDEELGYVTTDDSFSKILSDAATELSGAFSEAREHPVTRRVSDLIDELGSKLTGEKR
jgi:DnaJ-class molecular chaperone